MKPLKDGDCVGVFSSSSPTSEAALERLTSYFGARGIRVKVAPHTMLHSSYMAGSAEQRVDDLHRLLLDKDVCCVMTANGGASALQLVPLVDYALIEQNPKIICGLSDPTSLMNAVTTRTGVPTFHGPNGYNFGHRTPTPFTEKNWWEIVSGAWSPPYEYPVRSELEVLHLGMGQAEGRLLGGNLRSFLHLLGTPYMPDLNGAVLVLEEIGLQVHEIDALFEHLAIAGALDGLSALLVGQFVGCEETDYPCGPTIEDVVRRVCGQFDFPIITNVPLGHTEDKITLPLGCRMRVDAVRRTLTLTSSPFVDVQIQAP